MNELTEIRVTRHFNTTQERVFDAWLDQQTVGQWLFATPTGTMTKVEIDPRLGGHYTLVEQRDGEDAEHTGEYLQIDRPRRLAFSFAVPQYSNKVSRVSLELTPQASGCELALTHHGVLPEYAERTRQGWAGILDGLAKSLGEP